MRTLRNGKPLPDTPPVMRFRPGVTGTQTVTPVPALNTTPVSENVVPEKAIQIKDIPVIPTPQQKTPSTPVLNSSKIISTPPEPVSTPKATLPTTLVDPTSTPSPIKRGRGRPAKRSSLSFDTVKNATPPPSKPIVSNGESINKKQDIQVKAELEEVESIPKETKIIPKEEKVSVPSPQEKVDSNSKEEATMSSSSPVASTRKEIPVQDKTPISTSTTELRRSLRSPKKKMAPVIITQPVVERLAKPDVCKICGMKFFKKGLLQRHSKIHEVMEEPDQNEEPQPPQQESPPGLEPGMPGPILTKKRPSLSSLALKNPVKCNLCGMTFTRRAHLNRHMLLHSGVKPFACDVCEIRFTRKDHMLAHRVKHEKEHRIQCEQCGTGFLSWKILEKHIRSVHAPPKPQPLPRPGVPQAQAPTLAPAPMAPAPVLPLLPRNNDITCEKCGKKFLQKRYLRAHRKIHLRKEAQMLAQRSMFYNMGIDEMYDEEDDSFDAENAEDDMQMRRMAPKASVMSVNQFGFSRGNRNAQPQPRKPTIFMNRVVKLSADVAKNSAKKSNTDLNASMDYSNDGDGEIEDAYNLDDLMNYDYEAMVKQLPVQKDDAEGEDEGEISADGDYSQPGHSECSVCGQQFADRSDLRKHYRVHKKRFICRFCGLRLASAGSLMRHNLIHTGKKEFSCYICNRKFSRKDTLAVHLQAHEKSTTRINMPKPYGCRICGGSYTMKYNLIRHVKMCHSFSSQRADIWKKIERRNQLAKIAASQAAPDSVESRRSSVDDGDKDMVVSLNPFDLVDPQQDDKDDENVGNSIQKRNGLNSNYLPSNIKDEPMDDNGEEGEAFNWTGEGDDNECEGNELGPEAYDGQVEGGQYICDHCGNAFKNQKSLNTHKWYHSRGKPFVCPICHRGFKYSTDLSRHVAICQPLPASKPPPTDPVPVVPSRPPPPLQPQPNMNINMTSFKIRRPRGMQINAVDNRPFSCKICPQRFNHRSNLSRHVRLLHNATSIRKRIPNTVNFQNYMKKLQSNKNYGQMRFNTMATSQSNPQVEKQENNWTSWDGMNIPQESSNANANVSASTQFEAQRRNSTVLTPDSFTFDPNSSRPFSCNTCGKAFENKNNLSTHLRIHNKAFCCEYCQLKVATRGDLILHLRTHTGEKPFGCTLCEWKFSRKSGLNKHVMKYHSSGGKMARPWKYREHRQPPSQSGDLKFKFVRSASEKDFQIHHLQNRRMADAGMEISEISSVPINAGNASRKMPALITGRPGMPKLIPAAKRNGDPILKTALQNKEVTVNKIGQNPSSGVSITRTLLQSGKPPNAAASVIFLCRYCGTLLTGKQNYIDHMKGHQQQPNSHVQKLGKTSTKSFSCGECDKKFEDKAHLTRHLLTHENSEPCRCDICGKICSSIGFLSRHYQYVHPNKFNPAEHARFRVSELDKQPNQKEGQKQNPLVPQVVMDEGDDDETFPEETEGPPNLVRLTERNQESDSDEYGQMEYDTMKTANFSKGGEIAHSSGSFGVARMDAESSELIAPCERCGKEFLPDQKKARSDHIWYCKRQKIHSCPVPDCRKEFKLKHDVTRHLKRHTNERRFACPKCPSRFFHKQDVDRHLGSVHKVISSVQAFFCDFCDKRFLKEVDLHKHLQLVHGVDPSDLEPDNPDDYDVEMNQFQTDEEYEQYLIDNELDEEDLYNNEQDDEIPDPSCFLEQSMGETEDSQDFKCDICDKAFGTKQKLSYHKYYHIREAKHICNEPGCQEKFKLRSHLERHIRTYHDRQKPVGKIITCPSIKCGRKFTREYDLTAHIQKMHVSNMDIAPNSNPLSILKSTLVAPQPQPPQQRKVTSGEARPSASTSSSGVAKVKSAPSGGGRNSWPGLADDELGHEGNQQIYNTVDDMKMLGGNGDNIKMGPDGDFICDLCGKTFKEKKSADAHRYYHTREEKYCCGGCGARFKQNSDLQRHIRIHHNSKNPKNTIHCPHCYRSFTDDRYMRMHIRRYHTGNGESQLNDSADAEFQAANSSSSNNSDRQVKGSGSSAKKTIPSNGQKRRDTGNSEGHLAGISNEDMEGQSWDEYEDNLDEEDQDQRSMKQIEYLQYKNDAAYESDGGEEEGDNEAFQYSVSCGSCGLDLRDPTAIASHVCENGDYSPDDDGNAEDETAYGEDEEEGIPADVISTEDDLMETGEHYEPTDDKAFSCEECGENFSEEDLNEHLKTNHLDIAQTPVTDTEGFECPFCPVKFSSKNELDSHKRQQHGKIIQFHKCEKCGRQFTNKTFLEEHDQTCVGSSDSDESSKKEETT